MTQAIEKPNNAPAARRATDIAAPGESGAIISMIERAAKDPNVDIEKMERLFVLHEKMLARQAESDFNAALSRVQATLPEIVETGEIRHNNKLISRYKKWEDISRAIKPSLTAEGFALSFRVDTAERVTITAVLSHRAGHSERTTITLPADNSGSKNPVQAVASSVSYGKRYTAESLLNITSAGADDDAQGAYQPAGAERIDKLQADQLTARLAETETDRDAFLRHFARKMSCKPFGGVADIPASLFDDALRMIERNEKLKARQAES